MLQYDVILWSVWYYDVADAVIVDGMWLQHDDADAVFYFCC